MTSMARHKRFRTDSNDVMMPCLSWQYRIASLLTMFGGPLLLLYLLIRCEKNQCVLFQLPVVLPNHMSAYFSLQATVMVLSFLLIMFVFSSSKPTTFTETPMKGVPTSFSGLITLSLLLVGISLAKPGWISSFHGEYLRLFSVTLVFSVLLNTLLFVLAQTKIIEKHRDYCMPMAYFFGQRHYMVAGWVELKYFLYVHVGLVAWGLLDLLIFLNAALQGTVTTPLAFIATTQYIMVAHTLLFENFLRTRPFVETEGLGFFWMLRVLLYLPFMHSLPTFYAATTETVLAKPALMANCVFFLFGFVIYISSLHQKENFVADPASYKYLKSMPYFPGKRLMISGYWGIVQKPDYLGYMIMWMSWTLACGLSALAVLVLLVVYASLLVMLAQTSRLRQSKYGNGWNRYTTQVPYKLIPHVY